MRISDWSSDVCSSDLVGALPVDLFQGIGSGLGLDLFHGKILAVFLFDLDFDRHAVAIPTWHVLCVIARHGAAFDDDVLQYFVDGVPDVDIAVGIRRAIVKHEFRPVLAGGANGFVELVRSEEHTSELQSLMRTSYAVFRL